MSVFTSLCPVTASKRNALSRPLSSAKCPTSHQITHQDGDCIHNKLSNLESITRHESQKRFVMEAGEHSVNLAKRVQTSNGLRYCPVIESPHVGVKLVRSS